MKKERALLVGAVLFILIVLTALATSVKPQVKPTGDNDFAQMKIETTKQGTGDRVSKAGDTVQIQYTGTLKDGTKFDSSLDSGTPFEFTLGQESVIPGFEQAVTGMKLNEQRRVEIPSSLGYKDDTSNPKIPANSGLVFTVELVGFKDK